MWFGVHNELVFSALDFFMRRTGRLYFDIKSIGKLIDPVLKDLKNYFDWTDQKVNTERKAIEKMTYEAANFEYSKPTEK